MDLGAKLLMAFAILAGGATLAFFFRREMSRPESAEPPRFVLQRRAGPANSNPNSNPNSDQVIGDGQRRRPGSRTAADGSQTALGSHFASAGQYDEWSGAPGNNESRRSITRDSVPSGRGARQAAAEMPTRLGPPRAMSTPRQPIRVHTIVDGDSLPGLAQRYLGGADRYLEIYQFNRRVLSNPDLLPIGTEIRIPPRLRSSTDALIPRRRMVPIYPAANPSPSPVAPNPLSTGQLSADQLPRGER